MTAAAIEPGLLHLFRWYVGVRLGFLLVVLLGVRRDEPPEPAQAPGVGIVLFGALLIVLLVPWFQKVSGRAFLPIAIVLATIAPIADATATIGRRLDLGYTPNDALSDYWVPFFLLFVPFILVAWQYRYRWVLVFAVGSTLVDLMATGGVLAAYADDFAPTGLNLEVLAALLFARGALFGFLGFFISKLVARQREDRDTLRGYATAIEQISIARERNRLARELHDTLAHSMTGTAIQLEAATAVWDDDPDQARALVDQALAGTRSGLTEARRAIDDLRASPLEELGLLEAMRELVRSGAATSGVEIGFDAPNALPVLALEVEHAVYRVTEEAINNAIRHAQADTIGVRISVRRNAVTVTVRDDGRGFDPDDVPDGRLGITGMNERVKLAEGVLAIESVSGAGTSIAFTVPIRAGGDLGLPPDDGGDDLWGTS
jgi:signal transduction histidine kinase